MDKSRRINTTKGMSQAAGASIIALALVLLALGIFYAYNTVFLKAQPADMYELELSEYQFRVVNAPAIVTTVGKPLILKLTNVGTVKHEFMLVKSVEMSKQMIQMAIEEALQVAKEKNITDEAEIIELAQEIHDEQMHEMLEKIFEGVAEGELKASLTPGSEQVLQMTFLKPGIYTYVCVQLEGTYPEAHLEKGMFGFIIVTEG